MRILTRYLWTHLLKNLALSLLTFVFLFLIFDFFDRIDNILAEDASVGIIILYFLYKIPLIITLMFPVSIMVSTILTIGLLSKNAEITAMRAAGVSVRSLATPIITTGLIVSGLAFLLSETLVPFSQRRSREIYNLDIRQKDKSGAYSQSDFWWRSKNTFYSVGAFDSRDDTLHDISIFEVGDEFEVQKRSDAAEASWVHPSLGWTMRDIIEYRFDSEGDLKVDNLRSLPLPIPLAPADFYEIKNDPHTMNFAQLKKFINEQRQNGVSVSGYLPYLYEKFSSPLFNLIVTLVVIPFALRPARSGSMAVSILAALAIGFSYYAVHSFSLAMGKAEILPPLLAAWTANILMGLIGSVLMLGAEAPS